MSNLSIYDLIMQLRARLDAEAYIIHKAGLDKLAWDIAVLEQDSRVEKHG